MQNTQARFAARRASVSPTRPKLTVLSSVATFYITRNVGTSYVMYVTACLMAEKKNSTETFPNLVPKTGENILTNSKG